MPRRGRKLISSTEAVFALLDGDRPATSQPQYRLDTALETVTGEYEGYREIMTAVVERMAGGRRPRIGPGEGGRALAVVPTTVADDHLLGETLEHSGMRRPIRFEFGENDGDVSLFYERVRLEQT